jgi:hypothetical protein
MQYQVTLLWLTELRNKEGAGGLRSNGARRRCRGSYKGEGLIIEARIWACEGVKKGNDGVE